MKIEPTIEIEENDLKRLRRLVKEHDCEKDDSKAGGIFKSIENEVKGLMALAFESGVRSEKALSFIGDNLKRG